MATYPLILLNSDSNSSFVRSILQSVKDLNLKVIFIFFTMFVSPDYVKLSELDFLAENRPLDNIHLEDKFLNDTTYGHVTKN